MWLYHFALKTNYLFIKIQKKYFKSSFYELISHYLQFHFHSLRTVLKKYSYSRVFYRYNIDHRILWETVQKTVIKTYLNQRQNQDL